MYITKEHLEELKPMYIEYFEDLVGRTILDADECIGESCGYLILSGNKFTVLQGTENYGSEEFGITPFKDINYLLNRNGKGILNAIEQYAEFDLTNFNNKVREAEQIKNKQKELEEKQRRYNEFLKLKSEFESE